MRRELRKKGTILLVTIIAVLSLFSLRDKEVVLHVPDVSELKPQEAEAEEPLLEGEIVPTVYTGSEEEEHGLPGSRTYAGAYPAGAPLDEPVGYYGGTSSSGGSVYSSPGSTPSPLNEASGGSGGSSGLPGASPDSDTPSTGGGGDTGGTGGSTQPTQDVVYYGLGGFSSSTGTGDGTEGTGTGGTGDGTGGGGSGGGGEGGGDNPPGAVPGVVFITKLTPNNDISGDYIRIQGSGFSSNSSENIVRFGGSQSSFVTYISQSQIQVQVPQGLLPGFIDVSVEVNGGISNQLTFDVLKDATAQLFADETQDLLPAGFGSIEASLVKLCDIDRDKDPDLFVVDKTLEAVYLLVNDGSGIFSDETSARLPALQNISKLTDVASGDVNGDSYEDLFVTYEEGQLCMLFVNDGSGVFNDATATNIPAISDEMATCLDLGDVDGDGDLDVFIGVKYGKDILLLNDGVGVFSQDMLLNVPESIDVSSDLLFGDVDGDGDLDIVTTNNDIVSSATDLRCRIYINDGQGLFTDATSANLLPIVYDYSDALDFGDLDHDMDLDIVAGNYYQNELHLNNGNGIFTEKGLERIPQNYFSSRDAKMADIDGDGDLDMLILGEEGLVLYVNDGLAYFEEASVKLPDYKSNPSPIGGKSLELGDIDGDGDLDIIIGGSLYVLRNTPGNVPPALESIGNKTVAVGSLLMFNVVANDPNNDPLTYLVENLPAGANFDSQIFSWTPTANDIGVHKYIRFIARENTPDQLEDSETIDITVTSSDLPIIEYYTPAELNLELELGQIVQFGVKASDPNQEELTFTWILNGSEIPAINDFDSSTILIFPKVGQNTIEVKIANSVGEISLVWNITVGGTGNLAPEITSYTPLQSEITIDLDIGGFVNFGVTANDPEGDTLSYVWTFDGQVVSNGQDLDMSSYAVYATLGDHIIEVSVSDGINLPVTRIWILHIVQGTGTNLAPEITSYTPLQSEITIDLDIGGFVNFGVTANDPEGDTLSYVWTFDGQVLSTSQNLDASAYSVLATVGDHTIEVSVSDGNNAPVTHQWMLHIIQGAANEPPQITSYSPFLSSVTIDLAQGNFVNFSIGAFDPDGDPLSYSWTFDGQLVATGTILLSFTYESLATIGDHTVVASVTDGVNTPVTHTWTVHVIETTTNEPPQIVAYSPTSSDVTIDLTLGNFVNFSVSAFDPDGDPISYSWTFDSTVVSTGSNLPSSSYSFLATVGNHFVMVSVSDGNNPPVIHQWTVHVIETTTNEPPVITGYSPVAPDITIDLAVDPLVDFSVTAFDPDGDPLFYAWYFDGQVLSTDADLTAAEYASHATVGDHTVLVSVSDGVNAPVTNTWQLHIEETIPEQPPTIDSYSPLGSEITVDIIAGDFPNFGITASDPNNDLLSYTWTFDGQVVSTTNVLNSSDYLLLATVGDHIVEVSVTDGKNPPVTHQWLMHVIIEGPTNDPPVIDSFLPVSTNLTLTVGDSETFSVVASDPNGDTLGYSWTVDGTPVGSDSSSYTFDAAQTGQFAIKVSVTDGTILPNEEPSVTWNVTVEESGVDQFLDELSQRSFFYFRDEMNLANGLIRDRVRVDGSNGQYDNISSIATTGFGLTAMCIGAEKGWIDANDAEARVLTILNTFLNIQNNQAGNAAKYGTAGFFYHFVDMDTAERINGSELSTIDTAIFIAGALTAGEYFGGEVKTKAEAIYSNVDWGFFLDMTPGVNDNLLFMSWTPESGFSAAHWDYYSESLMLYLLAIGSPTHPIDTDVLYSFRRELGVYGNDGLPLVQSWFGALFTYQYSHMWFDFRNIHDAQNVNWFQNSAEATIANRQFCIDNSAEFGYGPDFWGLSASDGPQVGYVVYGAEPLGAIEPMHDGTVAPAASAGSMPMNSDIVIPNLFNIYNSYQADVWERYGFIDSFNLKPGETPWFASFYVGLDVGATLLMTENHRSGFVWNYFMQNQHVQTAMSLAGFTGDPAHTYIDEEPFNNFAHILLSTDSPSQEIIYNVDVLQAGEYFLVLQPFGMDTEGAAYVSVAVSVNGVTQGTVTFNDNEGQGTWNMPVMYKTISSSALLEGENRIVLTRQSGESWLSLKKIEIKSPRTAMNTWTIGQDDGSYAEFGDEWRIDDTYYAGEAFDTFEKALNINNEAFTDILFYVDDLTSDRELILDSHDSHGSVSLAVGVNGTSVQSFTMGPSQTVNVSVPTSALRQGWNYLRLIHTGQPGSGEWITWDYLEFKSVAVTQLIPPEGLAGAAFGADTIKLRWEASEFAGTDGYNIYRSDSPGGPYQKINGSLITGTSFQDVPLSDRTQYYYVVTAVDNEGTPTESENSDEISVTTGDYELDYRDGKEPNAFGGTSSSQFSYIQTTRYDGSTGFVRQITLTPGETGSIGLNGINLTAASRFSLQIKGTGGEKIEIGLKPTGGSESIIPVSASAGWFKLDIRLSDFGVTLDNLESLIIRSNDSSTITILLDGITFVRENITDYVLEVVARNVSDNSLATGMNYDYIPGFDYAPATQYIQVKYGSNEVNWKIWIYTNNSHGDPQYVGDQFNGLMDAEGRRRIPLLWRVYPGVQSGGVPCRTSSDVLSGSDLTWNYVKDKNDGDWENANQPNQEYSVVCFGRSDEWAWLATVPPGPQRASENSTFYVYTGGVFANAAAGQYNATIYFDITHE